MVPWYKFTFAVWRKRESLSLYYVRFSLKRYREGSKDGAVVRALASHQCDPGSNPGVDAICGLSLLLVLSLAPRGFSPGSPVFPSPQKPTFSNSISTRNCKTTEPLCDCVTPKSLLIMIMIMMIIIIIASLEFIRVIYSFIAVLKSHQPWPPRLLPDVQTFH